MSVIKKSVVSAVTNGSSAEWQETLVRHLLENKLIKPEVAKAALLENKVTNEGVGLILVRNGFLPYRTLVNVILKLNPERIVSEQVSFTRIPPDILDEYSIYISAETQEDLFISTMGDERIAHEIASRFYPDRKIHMVPFDPSRMDDFIARMNRTRQDIDIDSETAREEVLDRLIQNAIMRGASDIHIVPRFKSYSVFFRLLGVRHIVHEGSLEEYLTLVAQCKDRSRMDMAEKRIPQDGGFQIEHENKLVDMRVATIPGADGETVVIRILDPDRVRPQLEELGITRLDHWRRGINNVHGLCLICGPTGSGKTTTLNASIRSMDRFGKAIYSVEDPVEYRISYTSQVTVNPVLELNFSRAARAFMRGDPDVVVLGEVRDVETAQEAVKLADTGHLVLATLHTGTVAGAISRLRELKVSENHLRYLLRAVLVQSLMRTICIECSGTGKYENGLECEHCLGSRYGGRTVISECTSFVSEEEVTIAAENKGNWPSIVDDAYGKVVAGISTEEEFLRVGGTGAEDYLARKKRERGD